MVLYNLSSALSIWHEEANAMVVGLPLSSLASVGHGPVVLAETYSIKSALLTPFPSEPTSIQLLPLPLHSIHLWRMISIIIRDTNTCNMYYYYLEMVWRDLELSTNSISFTCLSTLYSQCSIWRKEWSTSTIPTQFLEWKQFKIKIDYMISTWQAQIIIKYWVWNDL